MASELEFVDYVAEQMQSAGEIRYRAMFGGFTFYCDDKVVALVCDGKLFLKPTLNGEAFIGEVVKEPPYPGAKPFFLIREKLEDHQWMGELIAIMTKELPKPKKKKPKKKLTE